MWAYRNKFKCSLLRSPETDFQKPRTLKFIIKNCNNYYNKQKNCISGTYLAEYQILPFAADLVLEDRREKRKGVRNMLNHKQSARVPAAHSNQTDRNVTCSLQQTLINIG